MGVLEMNLPIVFTIFYFLGAVLILLLVAFILQYLWNITMPEVFNLKELSFWQSFRLLIICNILFGTAITIF